MHGGAGMVWGFANGWRRPAPHHPYYLESIFLKTRQWLILAPKSGTYHICFAANHCPMNSIYLVSMIFAGISMLVSMMLKSRFSAYSKQPLSSGLSGKLVAEKMLKENGIYDVQVNLAEGFLSDHYNPANKTVNLSRDVYNGVSVASAAVAAHECGHAVQHATQYPWLQMRSNLVPIVQFSSMAVQWVLLAGIVLINTFPSLLLGGIILFAVTTAFSLITLPVEFDASNRALAWLDRSKITSGNESIQAKDALKWAAMTYVVAAVASIVTLLQYFLYYNNRRQ
jgi:Zn-dependent membrane protease YugP